MNLQRVLRIIAASLLTLSGVSLMAALWTRDLGSANVLAALQGSVYLIIAIGLYGQSRFSLFIAALATSSIALSNLSQAESTTVLDQIRMAIDAFVALSCSWVLWQLRHAPSR